MHHRVLPAAEAFWRPSNQLGVRNTDLAKQLGSETLGARLWRLAPGEWSTRHCHVEQTELYVVLEGTGRMRVDGVRQVFNDTDAEQLWLVVGAPVEAANTLEMSDELIARMYPDGPKAPPPELS